MTTVTLSPNGVATGFIYRRQWIWIDYPDPLPEPEPPTSEPVADGEPARPRFRPNPDYGPRVDENGIRHPGFAVRVAANPTGGELRHERDLREQLGANAIGVDDYLQEIAWRVREWRAYAEGEDGAVTPIPAPGECPENPEQWQAFYAIPEDLMYWVIGRARVAHLLRPDSPKVAAARTETPPTTSLTSAGTKATPIPDTNDPAPGPPSS